MMDSTLTPQPQLVDCIDDALPQTQCGRCGHAGCRPYAEAVAAGEAINRCPPGGPAVVALLAAITGRALLALDTTLGQPGPLLNARIDEAWCIGCTLCIKACPVDAIVGGPKRMHAVVAALCTGCELCLPPCPVDCIVMTPAGRAWSASDADAARGRHLLRNARTRHDAGTPGGESAPGNPITGDQSLPAVMTAPDRQAAVAAAVARARGRHEAAATEPGAA